MPDVELRVKRRARRALNAVVRPQDLHAIGDLDRVERALARMRAGKRGMSWRMPVLGQDHMGKRAGQPVDRGENRVAFGYRKRSAGTEIVLDVDDQQNLSIIRHRRSPRSLGMISRAMIST